jgi:hypothetical protein
MWSRWKAGQSLAGGPEVTEGFEVWVPRPSFVGRAGPFSMSSSPDYTKSNQDPPLKKRQGRGTQTSHRNSLSTYGDGIIRP